MGWGVWSLRLGGPWGGGESGVSQVRGPWGGESGVSHWGLPG